MTEELTASEARAVRVASGLLTEAVAGREFLPLLAAELSDTPKPERGRFAVDLVQAAVAAHASTLQAMQYAFGVDLDEVLAGVAAAREQKLAGQSGDDEEGNTP